jgi:hypothetical protein
MEKFKNERVLALLLALLVAMKGFSIKDLSSPRFGATPLEVYSKIVVDTKIESLFKIMRCRILDRQMRRIG